MITDALFLTSILHLYVILVDVGWKFWHAIKVIAVVESTWNDNEFFAGTIDTPKKSKEQHQKQ